MAIDMDIFSENQFEKTIRNYCEQIGWRINKINQNSAVLKFTMNRGTTQTVFIIRYESTLEFSCPSGIKFDTFDDIPHQLSTFLLEKNSKYKIGFWCIEEIGGEKHYSIMHNAEISLMDTSYFESIINKITNECDDFEQEVRKAMNR